ncbi:MAG: exodeoxyribonuclease VII large subunit [Clostridia bacterium]|nr:exodeoxyribonuclease VII large subunit [Clostridia bacterium]
MRFCFDDNGNEIMPKPYTVTEINENIKSLIEEEMMLQDFYIQAEVSNFKNHSSGHLYFTLKDQFSEIRAVMFKTYARGVKFQIENGLKVIAHARVGVYLQAGSYQLYVDSIQPDGIGGLHLAYEQLKEKLSKEGLFDESHKMAIPKYPEKIGIITSPTGAAVRDIINVATRRYPVAKLVIFPSLVQGEGAPNELIKGIEYFNIEKSVDVIIIGRGGGSIEDLWAFNNENLARAIYKSKIPVISGVGHEIDFTICDFVADKRAATPSAAAELATPNLAELLGTMSNNKYRLHSAMLSYLNEYKSRLESLANSAVIKHPLRMLDGPKMRMISYSNSLKNAFNEIISNKKMDFSKINSKLFALNPMAVLSRGYSYVLDSQGRIVKSVDDIENDEKISIHVQNGTINAKVISKEGKK